MEKEEIFYLFDVNEKLFDIFKIIRYYLNEYYSLGAASAILLKLIEEQDLPVKESLELIPYIHSGYLTIIVDTTNDR